MTVRQKSYLSVEEIEKCASFAAESWAYHRPNNIRERMPVEVWYDILKGKLAELTLHNYCKSHKISTVLEYPSFETLGKGSHISDHRSQLHDLSINNRKKEVKSSEFWSKYITLRASYFENGQYKYGNPDDIIFVYISLVGLRGAKALLKKAVEDQEQRNLGGIPQESEFLSHIFHNKQYKCDRQTFMDDFLIRAIAHKCDLNEIGFLAATKQRSIEDEETSKQEENQGEFTVLGEMPIGNFLKVARLVRPKYIYDICGLSEDPLFEGIARDYMRAIEKPPNKDLSFAHFVSRNFRIKKFDEPTFIWLDDDEAKPSEQLEEVSIGSDTLNHIRQAPDFEYVITPIELNPLGRNCQADNHLSSVPLIFSQEVSNISETKVLSTAYAIEKVEVESKPVAPKLKRGETNSCDKRNQIPPSLLSKTVRRPLLRKEKYSSLTKPRTEKEFLDSIVGIAASLCYRTDGYVSLDGLASRYFSSYKEPVTLSLKKLDLPKKLYKFCQQREQHFITQKTEKGKWEIRLLQR